jgi:acetyl-CoA carboxylase biotin carboxylase subunit
MSRILAAAEITGADAVHPGYGFLAENAQFAEICERSGLVFIGPTPGQIQRMGQKAEARLTMIEAGVPVIPGSDGPTEDEGVALDEARRIGYPVMIKAAAGGGGKGMRAVFNDGDLKRGFPLARNEAEVNFGNSTVYLEKLINQPRHVEIQLIGDHHGHIVHLGERDCSIQRRYQKLIEEAPSPAVTAEMRQAMGDAAIRGAEAISYHGVGTVEFLVDTDGGFYFMEMNTRIQVEHPVTELVTDIDLIKEQIRVAAGERLGLEATPTFRGHALECRINAEDPDHGFRPSPGAITSFHAPGGPGIRVDTHIYAGYVVPPYYDSLLAKLIVSGKTREEARIRAYYALEEFVIEGVHTTIPFLRKVLVHEDFVSGDFNTGFVEQFLTRR